MADDATLIRPTFTIYARFTCAEPVEASAIRHNIHVKAYTSTSSAQEMQAICAVMRKLLHSILKTKQPFDGAKFYAVPVAING